MGAAAREVIVRAATLDDAEAIRAIYNHEVEHETSTMDTVPRTPETQRAWIAARSGALSAWVAVDAGEVVAGEPLHHDPRKRRCSLSSVTSFEWRESANGQGAFAEIAYQETPLDMLADAIDLGAV